MTINEEWNGRPPPGTLRVTEEDLLWTRLALGQIRVGRDAARKIAARITAEHGFWDHPDRTEG